MGLIKLEEAFEMDRLDWAISDEGEGVTDVEGEKCKEDGEW